MTGKLVIAGSSSVTPVMEKLKKRISSKSGCFYRNPAK
jgi:ABC-type phosphate transport system substrate-binding protein